MSRPSSFAGNVIVDPEDNIWIISEQELIRYDGNEWTVYNENDFGPLIDGIGCMAADAEGNIWLGIGQQGMAEFDGTVWTHFDDTFFGHEYSEVHQIIIDQDQQIWIDYSHGGVDPKLGKLTGTTLDWVDANQGLPQRGQGLLDIDASGTIWYGSREGLARYDENTWTLYNPENTRLLNEQAWNLYTDSQGNTWVAADCYIARFNEDNLYQKDPPAEDQQVSTFTVYPNPAGGATVQLEALAPVLFSITVRIYDEQGAMLSESEIGKKTVFELPLEDLPGGLLLIQLWQNGRSETHKLVHY